MRFVFNLVQTFKWKKIKIEECNIEFCNIAKVMVVELLFEVSKKQNVNVACWSNQSVLQITYHAYQGQGQIYIYILPNYSPVAFD